MAVFSKKKKKSEEEKEIFVGQIFELPLSERDISPERWKTNDLLSELANTRDKIEAIDLIIDKTPDGKMAYNTYLRISNQGINVQFYNRATGKPIKKYDKEWRMFCARIGSNTSAGLDGLIDQLHGSSITHGGMAVEVLVTPDARDIEQIVIIDPKYIDEWKWIEEKHRYAAYQTNSNGKKRDLYDGNFYWIPHQPKPGKPYGTLQFEPAIVTMTQVYQLLKDALVIMHRTGSPKYDASIDIEKLMMSASPSDIATPESRKKFLEKNFEAIKSGLSTVTRDSNFIHFDSVKMDIIGGGVNGSGIDIRAWFDMFEPLIVNSFQLTPVLLGRLKSGSYSLGTAEYKIVKDNMEVLRRGSKRMIENIANMWARVHGFNAYAVATHNPVEWEIVKEKLEAELKRMEKARRAEEYKYVDHEDAAYMALGDEANPQPEANDRVAYVKPFGSKNKQSESEEKQKQEEEDNLEDN